ncbi:MAG: hypothetical protein APR62_00635 [Smithella sp. SDB]|nr:MAG: hypothetical protein APR62_00635 [Smithella sp. SDB]
MQNYADQVNLHARIYAMKGRLLSLRDYASIVREKHTFALKPSNVHDLIEAKEKLFREQIAPVIELAEAYDKYAPIFLAYLRQFEVHNAKILLIKAAGKESLEQWYDIAPFSTLEKNLLNKNLTLAEVMSLLADTYPGNDFKPVSSYLRMAINLDIRAARNIFNSSFLISDQGRKEFHEMMLKRIAVLAVIWSYRLRIYHQWSENNIRLYLEKFNNLFDVNVESRICTLQEELKQHIDKLRKSGEQEPSVIDIEHHLEHNYYVWVSFMFHRDFHSIYCVVAYLWLLFYQIKNLFRIIDGRRFGLSDDAILNKMICNQ